MVRLGGDLDIDWIQLLVIGLTVALIALGVRRHWPTLVRWLLVGGVVAAWLTTTFPVVNGYFERDQTGLWLGVGAILFVFAGCFAWWIVRLVWWLLRTRARADARGIVAQGEHLLGGVLAILAFLLVAYLPVQLRTIWFAQGIVQHWHLPDGDVGGPLRGAHVFRRGVSSADLLVVEGSAANQDPCAGLATDDHACQVWNRRAWYVQLSRQDGTWHLDQATIVWAEGEGNAGGYTLPPYLGREALSWP